MLSQGGRRLIEPVTLEVPIGDRICIVGPPGAGKSIILELMAGRHVLSSGHRSYPAFVSWHADSALGVAPRFAIQLVSTEEQRRVSTQFATFHQARWHSLFTEPDTVQNFLDGRRIYGITEFEVPPTGLIAADHEWRREDVLRQLKIDNLHSRRIAALSNGELRKLLLARALLARPRLLLLDDPLGGLDPAARALVTEALNHYCNSNSEHTEPESHAWREPGEALTLVVTTPRPEELQSLISRTVEIESTRPRVPYKTQNLYPDGADISHSVTRDNPEPLGDASDSIPATAADHNSKVLSTIVKLTGASVRAGDVTILDSVTLHVYKGEHWLITGPNGSGKSTLLALLLGDHPQSYVVDLEVLGLRAQPGVPLFERKRRLSHMAPELALHYPPGWSLREVVHSGFAATIGNYAEVDSDCGSYADHWLARLDLSGRATFPFGTLTEAEQRRVLLARALVRKPSLLLLDEPTQGLAEAERHQVHDLLDEVTSTGELTLILVSHHPEERPRCITHQLALQAGRALKQGPIS
jgi:molybdate transport system ATP-binding protein